MIFVSYRRRDAERTAGRLFGHLENNFRPDQLFMNFETDLSRDDRDEWRENEVRQCEVFLVVMGPHWLTGRDDAGQRLLDRGNDNVRIEIEAALRHRKYVIPLLVDGGQFPEASDLPGSIRSLANRHPVCLRDQSFKLDVRDLIQVLRGALTEAVAARRPTKVVRQEVHSHIKPTAVLRPARKLEAPVVVTARDAKPGPKTDLSRPVAESRALLVIEHDTIVDVVKRRFGTKLMKQLDVDEEDGESPSEHSSRDEG